MDDEKETDSLIRIAEVTAYVHPDHAISQDCVCPYCRTLFKESSEATIKHLIEKQAKRKAFLQEMREHLDKEYERADAIAAPLFGAQWSAAQAEEEDFLKEMETLITKEGERADAIAAPLFAAQWSAGQAEE